MNFSPSIYEHCAQLLGRRPWEVARDGGLLFEAQALAYRRYQHTPVVVGVDIYNLEAEAYGARIDEPEGNGIPAIVEHPLHSFDAILQLAPFTADAERIPLVLDAARRLVQAFPSADVRVPVAGPFSVAINLMGFDALLVGCVLEPDAVRAALMHLAVGQLSFCEMISKAGLDIAFFESAATPPLLSPELFETIELPALQAVISGAESIVGHPVPCVMGGDTTPILQAILSTGTGYVICPAKGETDQGAFLKHMESHPDVMVRVNMAPEITARGHWPDIQEEIERIHALVGNRENVCLGTGALPFETRPETIDRIRDFAATL
ncbi:MAG: hypothetical protein KAI66_24030 [Lentisphaeria bacterium]|nr:hypothetical protein [Lentisphaeria bacterium]